MDVFAPDPEVFERNVALLRMRDAGLADAVAAAAADGWVWSESPQGPAAATTHEGKALALCSKYRPGDEAAKLLEGFDAGATPTLALAGLGVGHHAVEAAKRMRGQGLLVVHEPSVARFAAALRGMDQRAWLVHPNLVLLVGEVEGAGLAKAIEPFSALVTQGTKLVAHPPTRRLDGEAVTAFGEALTQTIAFCRTTIATTLVNASRTYSNLVGNLAYYAAGASVEPLKGAAAGHVAVCVSAGPSLVKNVDLLRDEGVRRNVVVIAVQTALKPLLDRGVVPDFVTALDYSAICARFYESLPPLPNTTLVVEPKAHPVILDRYPGPIRVLQNDIDDRLLGDLKPEITKIPSGATVAHLSYYLAQFLGCDPICFIGQDLGFSDGLYYCPGTAVHDVWSSELNPFDTIENHEWERVARHKAHLSRHEDVHGRPIFSDEQMVTYLKQFERDFAAAGERGQRVLDCTEGGMVKRHAERVPLKDALAAHATRVVPGFEHPPAGLEAEKVEAVGAVLRERIDAVRALRRVTEASRPILRDMLRHQRDYRKMTKLHARLTRHRNTAEGELKGALDLVTSLNAVGSFRRLKHDHAIRHLEGADEYAKQAAQIERDQDNLGWVTQACDEALRLLEEGVARAEALGRGAGNTGGEPPVPVGVGSGARGVA